MALDSANACCEGERRANEGQTECIDQVQSDGERQSDGVESDRGQVGPENGPAPHPVATGSLTISLSKRLWILASSHLESDRHIQYNQWHEKTNSDYRW
mgnify:CR=1 FL=1